MIQGVPGGHEEYREMISSSLDGPLPASDAGRLEAHLRECDDCRQARRELALASSAMRQLPRATLPPALRESLLASAAAPGARAEGSAPALPRWAFAPAAAAILIAAVWVLSPPVDPPVDRLADDSAGSVPSQSAADSLRPLEADEPAPPPATAPAPPVAAPAPEKKTAARTRIVPLPRNPQKERSEAAPRADQFSPVPGSEAPQVVTERSAPAVEALSPLGREGALLRLESTLTPGSAASRLRAALLSGGSRIEIGPLTPVLPGGTPEAAAHRSPARDAAAPQAAASAPLVIHLWVSVDASGRIQEVHSIGAQIAPPKLTQDLRAWLQGATILPWGPENPRRIALEIQVPAALAQPD